jgi:small basic protein
MQSNHFGAHYLHWDQRFLAPVCLHFVDFAGRFDSLDDPSEDGMLVVQPRAGDHRYEELRTVSVWALVCHRQHIGSIESVFLGSEFVLESTSPNRLSSSSIAFRTSTLVHETFDNSVENHTIIVAFLDQLDEVFTGLRTILQIQQQMDVSHSGLENNFVLLFHHLGLNKSSGLFFGMSFIDYIPNNYIFSIGLRQSP